MLLAPRHKFLLTYQKKPVTSISRLLRSMMVAVAGPTSYIAYYQTREAKISLITEHNLAIKQQNALRQEQPRCPNAQNHFKILMPYVLIFQRKEIELNFF